MKKGCGRGAGASGAEDNFIEARQRVIGVGPVRVVPFDVGLLDAVDGRDADYLSIADTVQAFSDGVSDLESVIFSVSSVVAWALCWCVIFDSVSGEYLRDFFFFLSFFLFFFFFLENFLKELFLLLSKEDSSAGVEGPGFSFFLSSSSEDPPFW